jgi:hypothetical protein
VGSKSRECPMVDFVAALFIVGAFALLGVVVGALAKV